MLKPSTYKIGQNKGRPRVWLDGPKLAAAGFTGGSTYSCEVKAGTIVCRIPPKDGQPVRKVTGRPDGKPIIDILGKDVETAFPGGERVHVTYAPGRITIRPALERPE